MIDSFEFSIKLKLVKTSNDLFVRCALYRQVFKDQAYLRNSFGNSLTKLLSNNRAMFLNPKLFVCSIKGNSG